MKILSIIPARGGSKGIPGKNIIDVNGKPLIAYTIEPALQALHAGFLDRVIVSTDSAEIAEVSLKWGAELPFKRPASLAGDQSKSVDLVQHALSYYQALGQHYDAVLLLQPTSPLRNAADIEASIKLFKENNNNSLISVFEEEYINDLVMYKKKENSSQSVPLNPLHNKGIRRQDHGAIYVRNGCIYISSTQLISQNLIIGDAPLLYIMEKNRSINVDTMADLELLRKLL